MQQSLKRFLFGRKSRVYVAHGNPRNVFVTVDAPSIDSAIDALVFKWDFIPRADWDLLEELDPATHHIGGIGEHILWNGARQ